MTAPLPQLVDAVSLRSVTAGYGADAVLHGVSLRVRRGELLGVVGPSGCGKTSLLRVLTGQADVHRGEVSVLGKPVTGGRAPAGVGYVPQIDATDMAESGLDCSLRALSRFFCRLGPGNG